MRSWITFLLSCSLLFGQSIRGVGGTHVSLLKHTYALPQNGLIAAWDFAEGSGTTLADLAPGGNHTAMLGAGTAAPWWAWKTGLIFNNYPSGILQYATLANPLFPTTGGDVTVVSVGWNTRGSSSYDSVLGAYQNGGSYPGWGLAQTGNQMQWYDGGGWRATYNLTDGAPVEIAVSVSGTTYTYYVNGAYATSGSGSAPPAWNGTNAIGDMGGAAGDHGETGKWRFLAVWNRALSPAEHWAVNNYLQRMVTQEELTTVSEVPFPPALVTVPSNGLALTPPMGWNSWNVYGSGITDTLTKTQADAMVSNGLVALGYKYVIFDEWGPKLRAVDGSLTSPRAIGGLKALCDHIHADGLLCGLYTSPSRRTCGNSLGSYGWEGQDAVSFAAAGADYVKYDYCQTGADYASQIATFGLEDASRAIAQRFGQALQATGRNIVFSMNVHSSTPQANALWFGATGANLSRVSTDVTASWSSIDVVFDYNWPALQSLAGPGHWNDADMLVVGDSPITDTEGQTQFSLWAILASPLLLGNDLTSMSAATKATITNTDVIAVDQDPAGIQGIRASSVACGASTCEVWVKQLTGTNTCAIGMFNRDSVAHDITATFATIAGVVPGCGSGPYTTTRDLWAHASLGTLTTSYTATSVPSHGVAMIKVAP